MTFHGLSSPEDLKAMWKDLKHDKDDKDINIIWDYTSPEQLKQGFNIVNILYDSTNPTETGHYCLIFKNDKNTIFFNPVASHTMDQKDKLIELNKFCNNNLFVDMSGKQPISSSDCG